MTAGGCRHTEWRAASGRCEQAGASGCKQVGTNTHGGLWPTACCLTAKGLPPALACVGDAPLTGHVDTHAAVQLQAPAAQGLAARRGRQLRHGRHCSPRPACCQLPLTLASPPRLWLSGRRRRAGTWLRQGGARASGNISGTCQPAAALPKPCCCLRRPQLSARHRARQAGTPHRSAGAAAAHCTSPPPPRHRTPPPQTARRARPI